MDDNYDRLTNEAKLLLLQLYQEYKNRRVLGQGRSVAKTFKDNPDTLQKSINTELSAADILDCSGELESEEFVSLTRGSNSFSRLDLTNIAITRMQHRFDDAVKGALQLAIKALL